MTQAQWQEVEARAAAITARIVGDDRMRPAVAEVVETVREYCARCGQVDGDNHDADVCADVMQNDADWRDEIAKLPRGEM